MNVLDALLFGVRNIFYAGSAMPTRSAVNVHGAGVVVTDDVANERTDIEIPGLAGSISWATVTGLAASATSPLVIGGSQYIGVTHVRTGATPATTKGQIRATDGVIIAAKIDGTDETVLQTAGSTVQIGDDFGPIIERPADASNWYVEDGTGVRLLASSTAVGVNRRLYLYGGSAKTATAKGHIGLDSTGRLTVYADGEEKTCLVTGDAGGGGGSLTTACDIDYAAIGAGTPQDFKALGDGSYTIGGRAHAVVNTANASSLALGATGLRGKATNVGSSFPQVHLPLSTLAPAVSLAKHEVWIIARIQRIVADPATDYSSIRMALDYESWAGGDAAARWVAAQMDMLSGSRRVIGQSYGFADANNSAVVSGSDDEVYALRFQRGAMDVQYYGAAWGGSWPSLDALQLRYSQAHGMSGSPPADIWTPSDATLRLVWSNSGGTTNEWAIPRIQVLYR